ncbi:MAG TPA: DUF58 domain-containing protein [Acidimicrobiales bacterium]
MTRRLAVVALLGAVAAVGSPGPAALTLVVVNAAVVALWAIDRGRTVAPERHPGVERVVRSTVPYGDPMTIRYRVSNPTNRRLRATIADHPDSALGARSRRLATDVEAHSTIEVEIDARPTRRGRFRFDGMVVSVEGPWGLAARQATRPMIHVVSVTPAFGSRRAAALAIDAVRLLEVGTRAVRGAGGGDLDHLRDHRPGDDVRHLDQAATARLGRPVVKVWRAERDQPVLVLVDVGRTMAARVAGQPRLEWTLDAALALTAVASRVGDRIGLVAYDTAVRQMIPPRGGAGQLSVMVDALTDLQPSLVESDHRRAFAAALARFPRRAMVVLLTELAEGTVPETLVPALPLVARRHLVTIGSVVDPALAAWATERPDDLAAVHRQAAASAALDDRRRLAASAVAAGASVIDAEPDALAGRLTDAYLDVKSVGRL